MLGSGNYAVGFASADFIIWNLITEAKVVQIPCGGWRRPNSYFLGDVPELRNCFAYVKDEIIYIRRHWLPDCERKIYPQNLHLQFHGMARQFSMTLIGKVIEGIWKPYSISKVNLYFLEENFGIGRSY